MDGIRDSKIARKGKGCEFAVSVNANVSMGFFGSSRMLNAQSIIAVFMNTERLATCWPGQTLYITAS